ncbi:terminase family protein [Sphingomonas sp. HF-S4]|uniref:Terminase family protein n=1 Tax=Sphingomonas agrestis TaxID=3080540 RepID=A0ABU3Y872_9SPHN|nr:terminase family protein [Sphingomonas sp. HF-S4]MDV3457605.1 terminase family protein [Sphingomonas sp. HF-S4]
MGIVLPRLGGLDGAERATLLAALSAEELGALEGDWGEWAHDGQRAPDGDWRTWVLMAGRGFGKTRAGSQWVDALVRAHGAVRVALVAATIDEARRVMVEGPSGLLAVAAHPSERPVFEPSRHRLVYPNGAEAVLFSGANPDALRGPEHHYAWCDELAKWRHPQESWDMLQLGLRAGTAPRLLVTTTPRGGLAALAAIVGAADTVVTGGASGANPHLSAAWLDAMVAAYGGTRRGREEIEGVLEADAEGALWPGALIEACRGAPPARAALVRVVVGVDPPASVSGTCGIVVCGVDDAGMGYVLADWSQGGLSPEGWARRVAAAAEAHDADRVVVETNQGGEMVRTVLRGASVALPLRTVTATRGKAARAEPVAALFESGRVRLAGRFDALEAELRGLCVAGGYQGPGRSPDRADAMVWALWALMLPRQAEPRVWAT